MIDSDLWSSLYLFCDVNTWAQVMQEAIKPFLSDNTKKKDEYYIELKHDAPSYIKVALKTHEDRESLQNRCTKYFEHYFLGLCSCHDTSDSKKFNNIQFERSAPPHRSDLTNPSEFYFGKELSDLMLENLPKETINEDALMIFSLYLQICWIKLLQKTDDVSMKSISLKGYCTGLNEYMESNETLEFLRTLFEENKQSLTSLYASVLNPDSKNYNDLPSWLEAWTEFCLLKINSNKVLFKDEPVQHEMTYYFVPYLIGKQLGITESMKFTQNYFINQLAI
jgi:hypothetical protein